MRLGKSAGCASRLPIGPKSFHRRGHGSFCGTCENFCALRGEKFLTAFQNVAVAHYNLAVGHIGQLLVVGHNHERLA